MEIRGAMIEVLFEREEEGVEMQLLRKIVAHNAIEVNSCSWVKQEKVQTMSCFEIPAQQL